MTINKIKILFLSIVAINTILILNDFSFFPMIKFPHFVNMEKGKSISIENISIYNNKGMKIKIDSILKPFDKRFQLFTLRAIQADSITKQRTMSFLKSNFGLDNFRIVNTKKTYNSNDTDY